MAGWLALQAYKHESCNILCSILEKNKNNTMLRMKRLSISLSSNLCSATPILYFNITLYSIQEWRSLFRSWFYERERERESSYFYSFYVYYRCILIWWNQMSAKMVEVRLHGIVIGTNNGHKPIKAWKWNLWIFPRCFVNIFVSLCLCKCEFNPHTSLSFSFNVSLCMYVCAVCAVCLFVCVCECSIRWD